MSGEELLTALTDVDQEYITKSWEESKIKKPLRYRTLRWVAIFTLVLCASGTMVVVAKKAEALLKDWMNAFRK